MVPPDLIIMFMIMHSIILCTFLLLSLHIHFTMYIALFGCILFFLSIAIPLNRFWLLDFAIFYVFFLPLYSKVPAYLNVVDIAGLVKGAAEGQGLGNAFLSHINACDAIFHLCRKFLIFLIAFQHVASLELIQMTLKLLSPFTPQNWRSRTCPWNSIF